jgi:hypothetical protein
MKEMREMVEDKKIEEKQVSSEVLVDPKVNVRILLAAFWIAQFLLWTFGDMVSLLQNKHPDGASNDLLTFVAAPLAVIQTLMIAFSLIGKPKLVRLVNIIAAIVFLMINIGFISEAVDGWEYILGIAYVFFDVLIILTAWKWPKQEASSEVES